MVLSPDAENSANGETTYLPLGPIRRSRRLRRKSLELYRHGPQHDEVELEEAASENLDPNTVEEPMCNNDGLDTDSSASSATPAVEPVDSQLSALVTTESCEDGISNSTECISIDETTEDTLIDISGSSVDGSVNNPTSESDSEQPTRRKRNARKKDENTQQQIVSATKVSKGRKKKQPPAPSVEDIYKNRLWRQQMPEQKSWETIFEQPRLKNNGREDLLSAKKFKRLIDSEECHSKARLKKRRQRAVKRGWKPLTQKRDAKAHEALLCKLTELEEELKLQDKAAPPDRQLDDDSVVHSQCIQQGGIPSVHTNQNSLQQREIASSSDVPCFHSDTEMTVPQPQILDQSPGLTRTPPSSPPPPQGTQSSDVFYTPMCSLPANTTVLSDDSANITTTPICQLSQSLSMQDKSNNNPDNIQSVPPKDSDVFQTPQTHPRTKRTEAFSGNALSVEIDYRDSIQNNLVRQLDSVSSNDSELSPCY